MRLTTMHEIQNHKRKFNVIIEKYHSNCKYAILRKGKSYWVGNGTVV